MAFEPLASNFEQRVRDSFARQEFMSFIGAELTDVAPGYCEVRLPHRPHLTQQHGFIHGGALATLADTAAGYAAFSLMPSDAAPLTVEYKLNILRPGRGAAMLAKAKVIKPGRTLNVVQADVFGVDETGGETLCVTSLQTLMTMTGWDDGQQRA
ncbi:MAG: PaaI family thioesterase [Pseudomonadota bacterium]